MSHFIKGREAKARYFDAIAASLKPSGVFVLADLFGDTGRAAYEQLLDAWLASYASHGVSQHDLANDMAHIERDVSVILEGELIDLLKEAGFDVPIRFYQTFLFGGWMTKKRI